MRSNIEKLKRIKSSFQEKLINEGLTKEEKILLKKINKALNEAPIDYEGPERMDPSLERQILSKQTPYSEHPAMPYGDRDFVELVSSKRFRDSVNKVRRYLGNTEILRGQNPVQALMMTAMQGLRKMKSIENQNKEYLENLAVDLVKKELGIPEGSLQFDAELTDNPLSASGKMRPSSETPEESKIEKAFKHSEDLEDFVDAFEKFDMEKAKRRFINSLIQGAAKKGHYMFELVRRELDRIDPELINLYGVTQSLMDHLYWIMPGMEGMAASGEGQMGQEEVDTQTNPPTVKARAMNFPVLVHELIKGVYEIFGTHGLPDDPKQAEMIMGSEDTLPAEIWDMRIGPIFWEKFLQSYPDELFEDDMKHIQHYLFVRFSKLNTEEFMRVARLILSEDPKGAAFIKKLVDGIIIDLNKQGSSNDVDTDNNDDDDYDYLYSDDELEDL